MSPANCACRTLQSILYSFDLRQIIVIAYQVAMKILSFDSAKIYKLMGFEYGAK
ncbi:hypothetical protein AALB_3661 [Agarivorans albus MKT 106]|uniref:Uncharacterized protein n=1 Tax=Agarivorans albus MKT 106 TaxID=1331007 RepID=R9PU55_AGAAL|nr:hypothetical protein AALB_3661 [Agarivorans albus MKT 106]